MLVLLFDLVQASTTSVSFDWGVIITALAPVSAIIITWLLQRKTTHDEADKLAAAHEKDKQEAIARQEQSKQEVLSGQESIKEAVNSQLMQLVDARIKNLKEKIRAAGGKTNGTPPVDIMSASDYIDELERQLDKLLSPPPQPRIKRKKKGK